MKIQSCNINDKGKSCCSSTQNKGEKDYKEHWNKVYSKTTEEKLGWYETDLSPMLKLVSKTGLNKNARILNVGAGSTTLIDELLKQGFNNLIASDISNVSLKKLSDRTNSKNVEFITDDLTKPEKLNKIQKIDLWIDRAVLHFLTEKKDQDVYFDLLKKTVKNKAFVIIAEFNLSGAETCSGLPVKRYSKEILAEKLGADFELLDSFNYIYTMPSGSERPYIYTLFQKK